MAKRTGLGQQFYICAIGGGPAYNIAGDVGSIDGAESMLNLLDVTGINESAHERIPGLGDGKCAYTAYWNNAAGGEHAVLKNLQGTAVRALWLGSSTEGDGLAFALHGILSNYPVARANTGALTVKPMIEGYNGDLPDWGFLGLIGTLASGTSNRTVLDLGQFGANFTISAASQANPTVITTSTTHQFSSGDSCTISGSNSTPSIDGDWVVSSATNNTFTIPVNVTVAGTAGTVYKTSSRLGCVLVGILTSIGSGTNFTIKAAHSADQGVNDAWADLSGVVTSSLTAAAAESRVRSSGTLLVKRYVRLTGQGTYTSAAAVAIFRRIQGTE